MGKIFQQNAKMAKAGMLTYNFSLPAVETCPGAGKCAEAGYCFALLEQLRYKSAMEYRQRMLDLSKTEQFIPLLNVELGNIRRRANGRPVAIRIHASGDFYDPKYLLKWCVIAEQNPDINFYAYTKSIAMVRRFRKADMIPDNLVLILSMGSNQDELIDVERDRHSRIFATEEAALAAGYVLASEDDTVAWQSTHNKIGLVMFGARTRKGNMALGNI